MTVIPTVHGGVLLSLVAVKQRLIFTEPLLLLSDPETKVLFSQSSFRLSVPCENSLSLTLDHSRLLIVSVESPLESPFLTVFIAFIQFSTSLSLNLLFQIVSPTRIQPIKVDDDIEYELREISDSKYDY